MGILEMIRSPRRALQENWTVFKFLIVGLSGTIVNLGLLTLLQRIFNIAESDPRLLLANAIAVETSILNNFFWNDHFTFSHIRKASKPGIRSKLSRLLRYNLLSLVTFALNEAIFYILTQQVHLHIFSEKAGTFNWNVTLSSLIAIVVSFIVNYFGSSRWAWKQDRRKNDETVENAPSERPS